MALCERKPYALGPAGRSCGASTRRDNHLAGERRSEIRLARYRDREELLVVLRANFLVHWLLNTIVTLHHGPRRVEGIRIVERDVDLHRRTAVDQLEAL